MSFRNKSVFFRPLADKDLNVSQAPLVAASNIYTVNKNKVLRIIGAGADAYIMFGTEKADLSAAVDSSNGILIKANSEVFVSSGEWSFMKQSAALGQVIVTEERG